jgi:hypothetical protein
MSAYVFFDIFEITDQRKMEGYGRQIGLTVENYGGVTLSGVEGAMLWKVTGILCVL